MTFGDGVVFESFFQFGLQAVVRAVAWCLHVLRAIPAQVLAILAWAIALLAIWQLFSAGRETVQRSQAMHKIPCANCDFFTNDHRLKCTVHPERALTEEAVNCQDFESSQIMSL